MRSVLIVTHSRLEKELGAGQMALNIGEMLRNNGFIIDILSIDQETNYPKKWFRYSLFLRSNFQANKLVEYLSNNNQLYDIIELPNGTGFYSSKLSKFTSKIFIRSVQPNLLYSFYSIFTRLSSLKELFYRFVIVFNFFELFFISVREWFKADSIFLLGNNEFKWMCNYFPFFKHKYIKYLNTISANDQSSLEIIFRERGFIWQSKVVLWLGRWTGIKGVSLLKNMISEYSDVQFIVAGTGFIPETDLNFLKRHNVKIIPSFERVQLPQLLAQANVGLFTSIVEGWGLVLNEMLESGLYVFATDVGGVNDLKEIYSNQIYPIEMFDDFIKGKFLVNSLKYHKYYSWDDIYKISFADTYNK